MEFFIISLNVQASPQPELRLKTFSERMQEPFHTKTYLLSCYWNSAVRYANLARIKISKEQYKSEDGKHEKANDQIQKASSILL